jgi:hypothetical protein
MSAVRQFGKTNCSEDGESIHAVCLNLLIKKGPYWVGKLGVKKELSS